MHYFLFLIRFFLTLCLFEHDLYFFLKKNLLLCHLNFLFPTLTKKKRFWFFAIFRYINYDLLFIIESRKKKNFKICPGNRKFVFFFWVWLFDVIIMSSKSKSLIYCQTIKKTLFRSVFMLCIKWKVIKNHFNVHC